MPTVLMHSIHEVGAPPVIQTIDLMSLWVVSPKNLPVWTMIAVQS